MKIALISHLFPTELHPYHGKFIKDQFSLLNSDDEITAGLYVPTPHSIPFTDRKRKNTSKLLSGEFRAKRIPYLSFANKKLPGIISRSLSRAIQKQFKDKEHDVVHIHWLYPDALAIPQLKEMGFKCVLTIHGSDWYQTKNNPTLLGLFRNVLMKTDRVLYSGPRLKKDMESVFPWLSEKSEVIYNFVDTSRYTIPSDTEKRKTSQELNWDNEKTHALIVANIRYEKGIDLLLDAISETQEFRDINFQIIGALDDSNFGIDILKRVQNALFKNIYLYSPVSPNELIKYYHAADFYILPSRREGFNVSILEAMSTGLPVVGTPVGGNSEIIKKENGIVVNNISREAIREGIMRMKDSRKNYEPNMIRDLIDNRFGKAAFLKRLVENYNRSVLT